MEDECRRRVLEAKDQLMQELQELIHICSIHYTHETQATLSVSLPTQRLLWIIGGSCMTKSSELKMLTTAQ